MTGSDAGGWISVAVLVRPRGNCGELTAESLSSKPERFQQLKEVRLLPANAAELPSTYMVEEVWAHSGALIFKFARRRLDFRCGEAAWRRSAGAALRTCRVGTRRVFSIGCDRLRSARSRFRARDRESDELSKSTAGRRYSKSMADSLSIPFVKAICIDIRPGGEADPGRTA